MALSVDKTYRFVQFVANKQLRGWISPDEFNLAAEIVQLSLYSEKEANFMLTKKIGADMIPFMKKSSDLVPAAGVITTPADFRHFLVLYDKTTYKRFEEITQSEFPDIMTSTIVAPTASYPIVVVRDTGIFVYPTSINTACILEYLKKPTLVPTWGYVMENNRPVHYAASDVNFEFDDVLFKEISSRILQYVGVNLKDTEVAQMATMFQQKEAN